MRTSLLTVTNRPQLLGWWRWNVEKQSTSPDEIVIVTNHPETGTFFRLLGEGKSLPARLLALPPTVSIGEMRQHALGNATGDVILWADDDDWYHPEHFERLSAPLLARYRNLRMVLQPFSHHLILSRNELWSAASMKDPYLPATAIYAKDAKEVRFDALSVGEDSGWRKVINERLQKFMRVDASWLEPEMNCMHIEHGHNASSQDEVVARYLGSLGCVCKPFPKFPPTNVSREEWAKTKEMLAEYFGFIPLP